jgi:hypothetical protein
MANMIGPSFAGGFRDMAMLRDLAQQIADNPASDIPLPVLDQIEQLAGMTDQEIRFYETSMLDMNKEIFWTRPASTRRTWTVAWTKSTGCATPVR